MVPTHDPEHINKHAIIAFKGKCKQTEERKKISYSGVQKQPCLNLHCVHNSVRFNLVIRDVILCG